MGRPKVDHSQTVCRVCMATGNYAAKGMCRVCYGKAHYNKEVSDPEKRVRRLENARQWNREHRDQFNSNKNLSYKRKVALENGLPFVEPVKLRGNPPSKCIDCDFFGILFAKGRCLSCYGKDRHKRLYEDWKPKRMAKKYNISPEEYLRLVEKSGGACEICKKPRPRLVVDHDHSTGVVRGLLCGTCNFLVGYLEAIAPEIVERAKQYLASFTKS